MAVLSPSPAIASLLTEHQSEIADRWARVLETHLQQLSVMRGRLGFVVSEVLGELLTLKEIFLPIILAAHDDDSMFCHW